MRGKHLVSRLGWSQRGWGVWLAGLLGAGSVVGCFGPSWAEIDALEGEVAQLQARVSAAPVLPSVNADPEDNMGVLNWPGQDQAMVVWPWLQQVLQMQGLQVLALRPQGVSVSDVPEQTVLLHLQGRWDDWLALAQHMAALAPWWWVDQWQVVPAPEGQVRLELLTRLAWWPTALQDPRRSAWEAPDAPQAGARPALGSELFGVRQAITSVSSLQAANAEAVVGLSALSPDPRHWPVSALQLQGVWQQAGQWHAVLGAGLVLTTVRAGQRLGPEGWRVHRVDRDGVTLTMGQGESVRHLGWQGGKP